MSELRDLTNGLRELNQLFREIDRTRTQIENLGNPSGHRGSSLDRRIRDNFPYISGEITLSTGEFRKEGKLYVDNDRLYFHTINNQVHLLGSAPRGGFPYLASGNYALVERYGQKGLSRSNFSGQPYGDILLYTNGRVHSGLTEDIKMNIQIADSSEIAAPDVPNLKHVQRAIA